MMNRFFAALLAGMVLAATGCAAYDATVRGVDKAARATTEGGKKAMEKTDEGIQKTFSH